MSCSSLRSRISITLLSLLAAALLLPAAAAADEGDPPTPGGATGHTAVLPDHETVHQSRNSIHLFLGETWERVDGADITESGFTFGLEYFRMLSDRWATGLVVERAAGDIRGTLLLAQVEVNLVGGLWLVTGPGVEFRDEYEGHHSEGPENHGELSIVRAAHDIDQMMRERDTTVFVYRIGLGYNIHLGEEFVLAPTIDLDFVGRDEALVVGGILAYHF